MNDQQRRSFSLPSFEEIIRDDAGELVDTIVMNAKSAEEVPALIDRILAIMRDEWSQIDWNEYDGEFGVDPFMSGYEEGRRQAQQSSPESEDDESEDDESEDDESE